MCCQGDRRGPRVLRPGQTPRVRPGSRAGLRTVTSLILKEELGSSTHQQGSVGVASGCLWLYPHAELRTWERGVPSPPRWKQAAQASVWVRWGRFSVLLVSLLSPEGFRPQGLTPCFQELQLLLKMSMFKRLTFFF